MKRENNIYGDHSTISQLMGSAFLTGFIFAISNQFSRLSKNFITGL